MRSMKDVTIWGFGLARVLAALGGLGCALHASTSFAQQAAAPAELSASASSTSDAHDSGALLLAAKFGGLASFNGLSPFPSVGLEAGYFFGGTGGHIAAALAAEYTAPSSSGTQTEAFSPERIPGEGTSRGELRQKELVLQPTFFYRLPRLVPWLTPYVGIGPRIYFLESVVRGSAGGQSFQDTPERSTKLGFGVPLGAEFELGPGGLFAELFPHWAPMKHATTGDSHLGGMSLFVGYRAAL
jgi:hypothetical protein